MKKECDICPHHCNLEEGQVGICNGRINREGEVVSENYGKLTALALDPIEKKPLKHYYPGSKILSVGSYGCNLKCSFCQNCDISMRGGNDIETQGVTPEELVEKAVELRRLGNIGIAYTYNEPLIGFEFVRDCAKLARSRGLKNVVVTNGYICREPLDGILPFIDAFNIDLKGFTEEFYHELRGDLATIKQSIGMVFGKRHLEVTTLIIPGKNDSVDEMEALTRWMAEISPEIPLHISRFFPRYKMQDRAATPVESIYHLAEKARQNLKFVYEGNC